MESAYILHYLGSAGLVIFGLAVIFMWCKLAKTQWAYDNTFKVHDIKAMSWIFSLSIGVVLFGGAPLLIGSIGFFQAWCFHPLF